MCMGSGGFPCCCGAATPPSGGPCLKYAIFLSFGHDVASGVYEGLDFNLEVVNTACIVDPTPGMNSVTLISSGLCFVTLNAIWNFNAAGSRESQVAASTSLLACTELVPGLGGAVASSQTVQAYGSFFEATAGTTILTPKIAQDSGAPLGLVIARLDITLLTVDPCPPVV